MRMTAVGKAVLLLLVIGLMLGAWRLYGRFAAAPPNPTPVITSDTNPAATPSVSSQSGGAVEVLLITSASQKEWLGGEITEFNRQNAGQFSVVPRYIESREAMQAILNGKEKPVL